MNHWIGVDLGGTKILGGLFDDTMRLLARAKESTPGPGAGPALTVEKIANVVERILAESQIPREQVRGLGLGVPGQIVPGSLLVKFAPNLEWRDVDLNQYLPRNWPWPTFIENDVRVGTFGEWKSGAARNARHVVGIFAGTGIGGALILNNQLFHGFNCNAGEIGHVILHWRKGQSLEDVGGRRNLTRRAARWLDDSPKRVRKEWKGIDLESIKSSQIAEFFDRDDPIAVRMVEEAAHALGAVVGSMVNLISPEVIVLGGGLAGALGEPFRERVWEIALRYTLPGATDGIRFVRAALGDDAGIVGSAAIARAHVEGEPSWNG